MIELKDDSLVFSFPEIHEEARCSIQLQRTLRIPDDDKNYPLPPGLGAFPLRHVDDFGNRVPGLWLRHGGVMLPMYQSEALWLNFSTDRYSGSRYPFAVKVATGKIDAVTGEAWRDGIHRDPQDYMVIPEQPWLDGYCVEKGTIRQFVAMPLGEGYSVEEQITGKAEHGGIQIVAYPMKAEAYEAHVARMREEERAQSDTMPLSCMVMAPHIAAPAPDMGLAPGGRMTQEIYEDPFDFDVWDTRHPSRCFVHLANSLAWRAITGEDPPTPPLTSREYTEAGLPWFDYYGGDAKALEGSGVLGGLKSVLQMGNEKGANPLPENESVEPENRIHLGSGPLKPGQVREGEF